MFRELFGWATHKLAYVMLGIANGVGIAWSVVIGSASPAAIAAFCSVAVPALVGAVAYTIKTISPVATAFLKDLLGVWLDYRLARDKMQASTLSGQIATLTRSLESKAEGEKAARDLAELNALRVESMAELLKSQTGKIDDLTARLAAMAAEMAEATKRLEDANTKLHKLQSVANGESLARQDAENDLKESRDEIHALQSRLDQILGKVSENGAQLSQNAGNIDALTNLGKVVHDATAPFVNPEHTPEPMKEQ